MDRSIMYTAVLATTMFIGGGVMAQSSAGTPGASGQSDQGAAQPVQPSQTDQSSQQSQSQSGQSSQQSQGQMDPDKLFIKHALIDNMAEVQLSQLAQQKAQSQEVKQLAQQMVEDHQKSVTELRDLAQKNGVQAVSQLPQMKQETLQAFQQLQGQDFDKQYLSMLKAEHARAVSKYSDVAQIAKNQDLKTWAAGKVPTLQQHAQHVMSMAAAQGLSSPDQQAQPAGGTLTPSSGQQGGQQRQPGQSGSSSGSSTYDRSSSGAGSSGLSGSSSGTSGSSGSSAGGTGSGAGSPDSTSGSSGSSGAGGSPR